MSSNYSLLALGSTILIITIYIFADRKNQPLRFLYPGLLTFLLFTIVPILFSIYVGFTNLSTGHFLSFERVTEMLKSEQVVDRTKPELSYSLHLLGDGEYYLVAQDRLLGSKFKLDSDVANNRYQLKPTDFSTLKLPPPLSAPQVFALKEQLKELTFQLDDNTNLTYFRPDRLAAISLRYHPLPDGSLRDLTSNQTLSADQERGFFIDNSGQVVAPGFYINVGVTNFTKIFTNPTIRNSFLAVAQWTFIWATMTVILTFGAGMVLALLLNDNALSLRPLYRILFILPYAIPFFISVLIFKGMLNKDFGIINQLLGNFNLAAIPWLDHPIWAKVSVLMVNLWLGFPYMFLLLTGILQSIPPSVYEAATLDGASAWIKFRRITLPLTLSAIAPLLVGSFAFNLNNFVGIYLLTGGGPPLPGSITPVGNTDILISYTYRLAFEGGRGQDFGLASAIGLFIFVIIAILTLINFKLTGMVDDRKEAT
jgi:maltose/maltodextrin transport system permease protein